MMVACQTVPLPMTLSNFEVSHLFQTFRNVIFYTAKLCYK